LEQVDHLQLGDHTETPLVAIQSFQLSLQQVAVEVVTQKKMAAMVDLAVVQVTRAVAQVSQVAQEQVVKVTQVVLTLLLLIDLTQIAVAVVVQVQLVEMVVGHHQMEQAVRVVQVLQHQFQVHL
jgi:hypothetical protein